jgi:hypothetical protein
LQTKKYGDKFFEAALEKENWSVMEWLHEQSCTWSEKVVLKPAKAGHLHVLKWLHENGMWTEQMTHAVSTAANAQPHVVKWVQQTLM